MTDYNATVVKTLCRHGMAKSVVGYSHIVYMQIPILVK